MLMWEFVEVAEKDRASKTERVARGQQRTRLTDDEQRFLLQMEAEAGLIAITPPEQKQPLSEEELALLRQLGVAV